MSAMHQLPAQNDVPRVKDPVCGMMVDPSRAKYQLDHDGKTISFCNPKCLEKFRADPARYSEPTSPVLPAASPPASSRPCSPSRITPGA